MFVSFHFLSVFSMWRKEILKVLSTKRTKSKFENIFHDELSTNIPLSFVFVKTNSTLTLFPSLKGEWLTFHIQSFEVTSFLTPDLSKASSRWTERKWIRCTLVETSLPSSVWLVEGFLTVGPTSTILWLLRETVPQSVIRTDFWDGSII